jgi:hypothetical protein
MILYCLKSTGHLSDNFSFNNMREICFKTNVNECNFDNCDECFFIRCSFCDKSLCIHHFFDSYYIHDNE